jgi:hypothetical protein
VKYFSLPLKKKVWIHKDHKEAPLNQVHGCWRYYTHLGFSFHFLFISLFDYVEGPLV